MNLFGGHSGQRKKRKHDYIILVPLFLLVVFGLIMLASASFDLAKARFGDSYYYLRHQLLFGFSIGLLGFLVASNFYYRRYRKIAAIFFILNILLLFLIFTPLGIEARGAERWLKISGISFQPSEIMKIALVFYLASWLSRHKERLQTLTKGLIPFLIVVGLVIGLIIVQPNTSSAFILAALAIIMYWIAGARPIYFLIIIILGMLFFGYLIYVTPYRWQRIQSFLNQESDLQDTNYQINQTLMAIGSGGLLGIGFGQSTTKINYLPEPIGDSIFAVIAEEFGFVGSLAFLGLFLVLILRIFFLANRSPDRFAQLLLVGFGSLIAIQAFINIAAISGVIPLTGVPLPFISFGGTALAVFMTIGGIVHNVAKYT